MFTDPTGMEADGIIVGNDNSKDKTASTALSEFAATDEGRIFLADYAKKGDKVGNQTFNEDGKYHKKGIDLIYSFKDLSDVYANGDTDGKINSTTGRAEITVRIDNRDGGVESKDHTGSYDSRRYYHQSISTLSGDRYNKAVLARGFTIIHESYIHVYNQTLDYLDGGGFNNSHIDSSIKSSFAKYPGHWEHKQISRGANKNTQLFNTNGLRAMEQLNNRFGFGTYYNSSNLYRMMWRFSGSDNR